MGAGITYMGTKRALAPLVSEVIARAQSGVLLDAFSGMCSVGETVNNSRQVWNNDVQIFASNVAKALFTSRDSPPTPLTCADLTFPHFQIQRDRLTQKYKKSLSTESELVKANSFSEFKIHFEALAKQLLLANKSCHVRSPHLFAITYSGTYFGIKQAIEADSIIAALMKAKLDKTISNDEHRWMIIALGRAMLKVANSTGHFAQYLKPKADSYRRYIALRKRSMWTEWLSSISLLTPVADIEWRRGNRVFNQDSLTLIPKLVRKKIEIGVIYADPPYTDDQYSRYYHLLETLCLYDYPEVSGTGLYRHRRYQTPFSIKSKASAAIQKLIESCAKTGADLVLSYPTNGLVCEAGTDIRSLLRGKFKRVEVCHSVTHKHSTFGASKGPAKTNITELVYLARSA